MAKELLNKLDDIKNQLGEEITKQAIAAIKEVEQEASDVARKQAGRVTKYFNQLVNKEITTEEFNMYLLDIKGLLEMDGLQLAVETKVRVIKFIDLARALVINNLEGIIKLFK